MRLTINIKIWGDEAAYAGRAIDKPLPANFQNYDEYLIGILQYDPQHYEYVIEYYESVEFGKGKHYIAAATNKNSVMNEIIIRIYDAAGNLLDGFYPLSPFSDDEQYILCFELVEEAGTLKYKPLYDYTDRYPFGEEPFTPDGGSQPSPDIGNLIEQFWPMMQSMMSMMMQMMMMMAIVQAMISAFTSLGF